MFRIRPSPFAPAALAAGELTGRAIGANWRRDAFDNYGTATYTVPASLPTSDGAANRINIVNRGRFPSATGSAAPTTPAYVKLYAR